MLGADRLRRREGTSPLCSGRRVSAGHCVLAAVLELVEGKVKKGEEKGGGTISWAAPLPPWGARVRGCTKLNVAP